MTTKRLTCWLAFASTLIILGAFSNWLVQNQNDGKMPVDIKNPEMICHYTPANQKTHLPWLSDWIKSPLPFSWGIASPGDIVMYTGFVVCGLCLYSGLKLYFLEKKKRSP